MKNLCLITILLIPIAVYSQGESSLGEDPITIEAKEVCDDENFIWTLTDLETEGLTVELNDSFTLLEVDASGTETALSDDEFSIEIKIDTKTLELDLFEFLKRKNEELNKAGTASDIYELKLKYNGADIDNNTQVTGFRATPAKINVELASQVCQTTSVSTDEEYQTKLNKAIQYSLEQDYKFLENTRNGIYIEDSIVYIFVDQDGNLAEGTNFPTVLKEKDKYQYRVVVFADKAKLEKEDTLFSEGRS